MDQKVWNNLSKRLKYALNTLDISQTELARRIDVKPQVIQYLCAGNSQKSKFTLEIAEALNIDFHWLATGRGLAPEGKANTLSPHHIPLLSFVQIREWFVYEKPKNLLEVAEWIPANDLTSQSHYALVINDRAMAPRFDLNSLIIIEPVPQKYEWQQNEYVLVYLEQEDFIVFRQLTQKKNQQILSAINKHLHKDINLSLQDKILGICKEARWRT